MDWHVEQLRQWLQQYKTISVPQIQQGLDLDYAHSRALLGEMIRWGWVEETATGVDFPVCQERLQIRLLTRADMERIYPEMTVDAMLALSRIGKEYGVTREQIEKAVRGMDDTREALDVLTDLQLICSCAERYYLCITAEAVGVLEKIMEAMPSTVLMALDEEKTERWRRKVREILDRAYQNTQSL